MILLLLFTFSSLVQRGSSNAIIKLPECNGPEPREWNDAIHLYECPEWAANSGEQLCIYGFGPDHPTCFHHYCSCAYDVNGIASLICMGSLLDFRPVRAPVGTPGVNIWAESVWCHSLCRCPRLTREEDLLNYEQHMAHALDEGMLGDEDHHQWRSCSSSSASPCHEGERCQVVAERSRGSLSSPRLFQAVCMSAVAAAALLSSSSASASSSSKHTLNGRRMEDASSKQTDSSLDLLSLCACNASYVSRACCDSGADGMVWEESDRKMGELELELDL